MPLAEVTQAHSRLTSCGLEVEEARAYWARRASAPKPSAQQAFEGYWFGAKSLARVEVLLLNMRARFDAFPDALAALASWRDMSADARRIVCHWHLQLSDPLYRAFTGSYLAERRDSARPSVTLDLAVDWVTRQEGERWAMTTRVQLASKLLSSAHAAQLVTARQDPRPLAAPKVPSEALEYLLYLLRQTHIEGSLLDNPYLASVGLRGEALHARLRGLPSLDFQRQLDLTDFGWRYPDLKAWAEARFAAPRRQEAV
jgi:hypothetical protein